MELAIKVRADPQLLRLAIPELKAAGARPIHFLPDDFSFGFAQNLMEGLQDWEEMQAAVFLQLHQHYHTLVEDEHSRQLLQLVRNKGLLLQAPVETPYQQWLQQQANPLLEPLTHNCPTALRCWWRLNVDTIRIDPTDNKALSELWESLSPLADSKLVVPALLMVTEYQVKANLLAIYDADPVKAINYLYFNRPHAMKLSVKQKYFELINQPSPELLRALHDVYPPLLIKGQSTIRNLDGLTAHYKPSGGGGECVSAVLFRRLTVIAVDP